MMAQSPNPSRQATASEWKSIGSAANAVVLNAASKIIARQQEAHK